MDQFLIAFLSSTFFKDANSLRVIATTMQELESSRKKLADNLDRNVKREIVQLYSGSDNQSLSCKAMKESRKSLDKIADEHEEKNGFIIVNITT